MQFYRTDPRFWPYRYAVIPGTSTALHVRQSRVEIDWIQEDMTLICQAVECATVRDLVQSVIEAKVAMSGNTGGRFVINEFGQVLVPSSAGDGERCFVGEIRGDLRFHNPLDGSTFCLNETDGLQIGSVWNLPYLGVPYNLSSRSQIYFWDENDDGGQSEYPNDQDRDLIRSLRSIRRYGAVRFIVNHHGVVLTKRPPDGEWRGPEEVWTPVYVGRLNYSKWYPKQNI